MLGDAGAVSDAVGDVWNDAGDVSDVMPPSGGGAEH